LVRRQRDTAWHKLDNLWRPVSAGGQDMTLVRMPEEVKIELCNEMALPPAGWSASTTMSKTESKVSSNRHEFQKLQPKRKVQHAPAPFDDLPEMTSSAHSTPESLPGLLGTSADSDSADDRSSEEGEVEFAHL